MTDEMFWDRMDPAFPVILFYKYVQIDDPAALVAAQRQQCSALGLKGRVLIATEGINGTLAGPNTAVEEYMASLQSDDRFADLEFKISAGDERTFPKLVVKVRPEIVTLAAGVPLSADLDNHLSPSEWKKTLEEEPDVIVLDVRNRYESVSGHFAGAVTCDIEHFRELPGYMDQLEHLKDRKLLMYCTGGIRCEKASALFRHEGFTNVFQLHGGIAAYQEQFGNEHWLGECFVFDQRMTVAVDPTVAPLGRCAHSGKPTSRYVNCLHDPCHSLFLLAAETEAQNPDARLCLQCTASGMTSASAAYNRAE